MSIRFGSISLTFLTLKIYVPVAQMDRASASGAEGRAFESLQARSFFNSNGRARHILTARNPISTILKTMLTLIQKVVKDI